MPLFKSHQTNATYERIPDDVRELAMLAAKKLTEGELRALKTCANYAYLWPGLLALAANSHT